MRSHDIIPILCSTTVMMICSTQLFWHYWSRKIYCHVVIGLHSKLTTVKCIMVGASVTCSLVSLPANVYVHDTHARIYTTITFSVPAVCPRHDYRVVLTKALLNFPSLFCVRASLKKTPAVTYIVLKLELDHLFSNV